MSVRPTLHQIKSSSRVLCRTAWPMQMQWQTCGTRSFDRGFNVILKGSRCWSPAMAMAREDACRERKLDDKGQRTGRSALLESSARLKNRSCSPCKQSRRHENRILPVFLRVNSRSKLHSNPIGPWFSPSLAELSLLLVAACGPFLCDGGFSYRHGLHFCSCCWLELECQRGLDFVENLNFFYGID